MIPCGNIKDNVQRVRALAVTLCIVLLFSQHVVAQAPVKTATVGISPFDTSKTAVRKSEVLKVQPSDNLSKTTVPPTPVDVNRLQVTADTVVIAAQPTHSPTKAMWMSAVLPGLGQVYNKQAWKIPIIYAGAAGVTYFAITNYQGREKFKNEYINRQDGNTDALLERYANYPDANIYSIYQSYNRNFQLSLIVGGLFYALNIIDAYVYGHLFDFEITDDVSMHIRPNVDFCPLDYGLNMPVTGLTLQVRF